MDFNDFNTGYRVTPFAFHQLGIFVIDGCGTITVKTSGILTKADAVNKTVKEKLSPFKTIGEKLSLNIQQWHLLTEQKEAIYDQSFFAYQTLGLIKGNDDFLPSETML